MYSLIASEALSRLVHGIAPALFLKNRLRLARLFALVTGTGSPFLKMKGGLYIYIRISVDREGLVKDRQARVRQGGRINEDLRMHTIEEKCVEGEESGRSG